MKTFSRISISAAVLAGTLSLASPAFAQEATEFDFNAGTAAATRSEVVAEVLRARAEGTLARGGEASEFTFKTAQPAVSRADVVAETLKAKRLDLLDHGESNARHQG
ncbi:MAG TPA: hypothetical protein VFR86_02020 [Burkholderiaceae bacterium]|nr:hypothetical protein [Burkholderiaceae bacterium]